MAVTLTLQTQAYIPWANLAGTYTSVRTAGNTTAALTNLAKYVVSLEEAAKSFGVYQANDVIWTLEKSDLTAASITAKPRDTITQGSTIYNVLAVDETDTLDFQKVTTRNLAIHNQLNDLAAIFRPIMTQETTGARAELQEQIGADVVARFQPIRTQEVEERGKRYAQRVWEVTLAQDVEPRNVAGDWGVVRRESDNKLFDITGYRQAERIDELSVIEAVERL